MNMWLSCQKCFVSLTNKKNQNKSTCNDYTFKYFFFKTTDMFESRDRRNIFLEVFLQKNPLKKVKVRWGVLICGRTGVIIQCRWIPQCPSKDTTDHHTRGYLAWELFKLSKDQTSCAITTHLMTDNCGIILGDRLLWIKTSKILASITLIFFYAIPCNFVQIREEFLWRKFKNFRNFPWSNRPSGSFITLTKVVIIEINTSYAESLI